MATGVTKKADMIVPEVFGDIVTAKFKGKLVIANFALTDTTLVGNPGDTVHFPKWNPIGDAEDLEEDVAMVPEKLTSSDAEATVKEVGKAVTITDQALLSSIGDPLDEAGAQVGKVVARKIDADLILKATKVDGIYEKDPMKYKDVKKIDQMTYIEALNRNIKVMDSTAITLCMDNNLEIVVFDIFKSGNIQKIIMGEKVGSIVKDDKR